MSKPKKWKPGEIGYIYTNELYDISFDRSVKVEVLADLETDLHPVKVKSLKSGIVYYCRHEEIQTRAAKAERKSAKLIIPEKIKEQAEELAAKRMEKIMEKPTFEEVCEKFYALAKFGAEEIQGKDIVLQLAEKAPFEEIKNGVIWK
ncbi:hypothetical protein AAK979_05365 [Ileibacterium valens]|uniref:hypothetical protein n=1 Tax=Ileibacterium valens TaxID=1862668 RepID=UPI0035121639